MMLYSWWHLLVSRHRCPSLLTSSRWPWSPLDSHVSLDSWHDCSAAWGPQARVLHLFLDERAEKPRKCLDALLCCSGKLGGAVSHLRLSDMLTRPHLYFLCSCVGQTGGREEMRGLLPPQVPLRKQGTSLLCSDPHPTWAIQNFGVCVTNLIFRSSFF